MNLHDNGYDLDEAITHIVNRYGSKSTALIMVLQDVQKHYRYLPMEALKAVAKKMNLPIAQIYSVATFYKAFSLTPKGKHHVCVCTGTACHVRQAAVIVDNLSRSLNIQPGETTQDGEISFETVNCLGACALGPLVTVDDEYHGNMTVTILNKLLNELRTGKMAKTTEEVK
ncbi:NAD(P)H-dependent oxidoreductase subunit E [candidate division KSB1 bacterium]|nr:MAG: NAD(P)H-dependent oxidoreductase subunit E [candidate division KSB1 bacterium]